MSRVCAVLLAVVASVLGLCIAVTSATASPSGSSPSAALRIPGGGGTPHAGGMDAHRDLSARPATAPPPAGPPADYTVFGIDVASYQKTINWTNVAAAGMKFAYVKATEGTTYTNPYYASQYSGALAAGLDVGSYAFARPDANNPAQQAAYLVSQSVAPTANRTLPYMLDLEAPYSGTGVSNQCWGLTPAQMVTWIRTYVDAVQAKTGMPMLIYTTANWWNPCTGSSLLFGDQLLDVAYWSSSVPTTLPTSWTSWTFWQYADSGSQPGDQDAFYGSPSQLVQYTYPTIGQGVQRFSDVPTTNPFYADINWLAAQGITGGYSTGQFQPAAPVSRQAMAQFLYNYANHGATAPACTTAAYPDVSATQPFCAAITWLTTQGIAGGYADGTFQPGASVSRQAMAAFMYRLVTDNAPQPACTPGQFSDVSKYNAFCGYISWLTQHGIASGYSGGDFQPGSPVSRQAMAHFLHQLSSMTATTSTTPTTPTTTPTATPTTPSPARRTR